MVLQAASEKNVGWEHMAAGPGSISEVWFRALGGTQKNLPRPHSHRCDLWFSHTFSSGFRTPAKSPWLLFSPNLKFLLLSGAPPHPQITSRMLLFAYTEQFSSLSLLILCPLWFTGPFRFITKIILLHVPIKRTSTLRWMLSFSEMKGLRTWHFAVL